MNDEDYGMTLDHANLNLLAEAASILHGGFAELPPSTPRTGDMQELRAILHDVARRMHDNYPYQHPLYAGQMLKPPHAIAHLAYALAMTINPNNHALDGGRASSAMEKEAVAELAAMMGWHTHLGHLTSSGTIANLEALWVASQEKGREHTVVASSQAHYTHSRMCHVLGIPFQAIPTDEQACMDVQALRAALAQGTIGTVVVTLGTTATGSVDPLPAIVELQQTYHFRIHVDAAYGGYFVLADNLAPDVRAAYDCLAHVDSVVIDPHKHGLQPYGCGCVLFKDPSVGRFYKHDSPYTYFTSDEMHLGEISLECSRAGASAVALWATQRLLPLVRGGAFAHDLAQCRAAALKLYDYVCADTRFMVPFAPRLDIVVWAVRAPSVSEASQQARVLFSYAAERNVHVALAELPTAFFAAHLGQTVCDRDTITCLRLCLMKPNHLEYVDTIWETIVAVMGDVV